MPITLFTFFLEDTAVDSTTGALANHPAWIKLDKLDCGESAADRIIGGYNAALGQFPWIARLGYIGTKTHPLPLIIVTTLSKTFNQIEISLFSRLFAVNLDIFS